MYVGARIQQLLFLPSIAPSEHVGRGLRSIQPSARFGCRHETFSIYCCWKRRLKKNQREGYSLDLSLFWCEWYLVIPVADENIKEGVSTFSGREKMVSKGKKIKALALLSGGLDSTLAVKLMLGQGVDVEAVNFVTPFCLCRKGGCGALEVAENLNVPLKTINVGGEYLRIVRKPRFGYGRNMNPCVDCRIFMLKKAKE